MYDVVVVGSGIGGLAVAALVSARGMNTCLLERQSQVGGCVARVEFSGYEFEPGMGLYTSFGAGGVYEKLFSPLPVEMPAVSGSLHLTSSVWLMVLTSHLVTTISTRFAVDQRASPNASRSRSN